MCLRLSSPADIDGPSFSIREAAAILSRSCSSRIWLRFGPKQICFQFCLDVGDAVVKVFRPGKESGAMERGPLQIGDRVLFAAEELRMNDGMKFSAQVFEE